jgi:hypothetical protein
MVRRSQSIGVHRRLRRGDAASGLSSSGERFQARREMTRLRIGSSHFLISAKVQNLELVAPPTTVDRFFKASVGRQSGRRFPVDPIRHGGLFQGARLPRKALRGMRRGHRGGAATYGRHQ